jgi:UDP-4-amino-4,6-dideoxy-N-acetyl-beta-L-altrosamine N-acetyltransferase
MKLDRVNGVLRKMTANDLSLVLEWRNSPRIRSYMYSDDIITWEEHEGWFGKQVQSGKAIPFIFEFNGIPAGLLQFKNIDRQSERCHWGFYLGRYDLPKGTGSYMCELGLRMAFEVLDFRKICGEVLHYNMPSIGLHQRLGFVLEGTSARHVMKNGQYIDVLHYAKFREQKEGRGDDVKLSSR